jgi:hypothetical protein
MQRILILAVVTALVTLSGLSSARGEGRRVPSARSGPWIVYRYPLFREGNRPAEARRHSQDYYWPSDASEVYPKFYGGFHSRYFDQIAPPNGTIGLRGTAW